MRTRTPFEDKLMAIAEPVADGLDMEIVRIRVMGGKRRNVLQIMAEKRDGTMDVEDCATLSRTLSAVFDVEDPFAGEWALEVSSPGIDRPLTTLAHFSRWVGFEARIELDRPVEGRRKFSGELAGVDANSVLIDLAGEADVTAAIPFDWIAEAKLVLTDELVAESLKRRGDPLSDPDADFDEVEYETDADANAGEPLQTEDSPQDEHDEHDERDTKETH